MDGSGDYLVSAGKTAVEWKNLWQPIETAPMDGTHLLLVTGGYAKVRIGWFYANSWHWDGDYNGVSYGKRPTHWMQIPTPPTD